MWFEGPLPRLRTSEKWRRYPGDVLPMHVAEMDFPLAPAIARALHDAVDASDTGYAWPSDLPSIFASYARGQFDWTVSPGDVVIVNDIMGGITEALLSLTNPSDGVIIMPPVYPPFFETIGVAARRVVEVPLRHDDGRWSCDWTALETAMHDGSRAVLLCNPHNPVGRVFTREELEQLADLAAQHGALVISDEIHAPLLYPGHRHIPFATIAQDRGIDSVTLMSASKGWNIPGLKCAQMVAGSERVRERFSELPKDVRDRIGHFGVIATAAAYEHGGDWLRQALEQLRRNRELLAAELERNLPNVGYRMPEATYLAWLDCRALSLGADPARHFLEHGRVSLGHGTDFGAAGSGFARFNFATSPAAIAEGVARMKRSLTLT
jgi:cystathionine beta-lyase